MTNKELSELANSMAATLIKNMTQSKWETLEQHAKENWSVDADTMIRMGLRETVGLHNN